MLLAVYSPLSGRERVTVRVITCRTRTVRVGDPAPGVVAIVVVGVS